MMQDYTPLILEEQEKVVLWVRNLMTKDISFSTAIEYLISDNKTESELIAEGLEEVRKIYISKNQSYREQLLKALVLSKYRLDHDIKEGQVVSNGSEAGFACNVSYSERNFELSVKKDGTEILGLFKIDDFRKV